MRFRRVVALFATIFAITAAASAVQTGFITTVAGTGALGFNGDNIPATSASLAFPVGVALDTAGNLFIADVDNHRIRRVDAGTGLITTVAGTGTPGFNGDDILATNALLARPIDVALDAAGNVFIADFDNHSIRRVDAGTGLITTVAGTGTAGFSGDNSLATNAKLHSPIGIALDTAGNLFIGDTDNGRIRRVDAGTSLITTVAGTGAAGFNGDNIPATSASFFGPSGIAIDTAGNLFIADQVNHRVRRVDAGTGLITTVAGTGTPGFNGDNILATTALLARPFGVALDTAGNLFIGEFDNNRIRRVDAGTGLITTVAGTGAFGFNGDNILATNALLIFPIGMALDTAGNLFFADAGNNRIRRVEGDGVVVIEVRIDIKPGSGPNSINAKSKGDIPVAILATADYDPLDVVHGVDPATVLFAGAGKAHPNRPLGHWEDVDGDGDTDLLLHFDAQDVFNNPDGLSCGDTGAVLTGLTYDGVSIEGMDFVVTVACK